MRKIIIALLGCGLLLAHSAGWAANGYCDSNGRNTVYFWQESVTVGDVTITSGSNGGYQYVPDSGITLQPGTNTIDLNPGYRSYNYPLYWRAWLDLNGDQEISADEELFLTTSRGPVSIEFELPDTFTVDSTLLRIAMKFNGVPSSCEVYYGGETEDLVVQLAQPEPLLEDTYHLTLDSNFKVTRNGAIGDAVSWVVEKDGAVIANRNAAGELEYRNFNNIQGSDYRVWVEQFIDGAYQQVSNIVAYTPGTTDLFDLQLSEGYQINRSGELGADSSLTWVIEMDGAIVLERLAGDELNYVYYRNWDGTRFRVWLKQFINGQYEVVSNTVEYQTNQTEFNVTLDQKYKLTRNGQPGDQVRWIVEQDGLIIEDRDASNEMAYTFVNAQPGSRYQMWLQMNIDGQDQVVSNIVTYDEPVEQEYRLNLEPGYRLSRSGALGDNVSWVIVKDGDMALQRNASNELMYTYFDNSNGSYFEVYLQKFVNSYYQRVSNVVRYKVQDYGYTINLDAEYQLTRSGAIGDPLVWVVEENGVQVLQQDASQQLFYTYPGNSPGVGYRVWLGMVVDGTLRPVSNAVSYYVQALPQPIEITLNPDYSVSRTGELGDPLIWVVEENGYEVGREDASKAMILQYPNPIVGAEYRIWLEDAVSWEVASNEIVFTYQPPQQNYSLTLNEDYSVTRSGVVGDQLWWIVEMDGVYQFGMPADQALTLLPSSYEFDRLYTVRLMNMEQTEDVAEPIRFTYVEPGNYFSISISADGSLIRDGFEGDPLWWVVEEDGVVVREEWAADSLTYAYPDIKAGSSYRFWLVDYVTSQKRVVSNLVSYMPTVSMYEYQISLNSDGSVTRSGQLGEQVGWMVLKNGEPFAGFNAENELTFYYEPALPSGNYQIYLEYYGAAEPYQVSEMIDVTVP